MTTMTATRSLDLRRVRRAIRSPKGNLLIILSALTLVAILAQDSPRALPAVMNAVGAAMIADIAIQRLHRGIWAFPTAGILSGLFVALLLSPYDAAIIAPMTAVLAITTKHLFRARLANIFNPAALALVVAALLFDAGHSWWGALPDLGWSGLLLVAAAGWYTAQRINKLPMVLVFLGSFYSLATAASFLGEASTFSGLFRSPDVHAALFFAFFMLDDPPTSPVKYRDQVMFGLLVGGASFAFFELFGWLYFMLAALLLGNVWWALVRTVRARNRRSGPATRQRIIHRDAGVTSSREALATPEDDAIWFRRPSRD